MVSRSRDEDQQLDPPLTAVWTAYATHHSRRSLIQNRVGLLRASVWQAHVY